MSTNQARTIVVGAIVCGSRVWNVDRDNRDSRLDEFRSFPDGGALLICLELDDQIHLFARQRSLRCEWRFSDCSGYLGPGGSTPAS